MSKPKNTTFKLNNSASKLKENRKRQSLVNFQSVYKSRDRHQIIKKQARPLKNLTQMNQQQTIINGSSTCRSTNLGEDLKRIEKKDKIDNKIDEANLNKLRQSCTIMNQSLNKDSKNNWQKSLSQPKPINKNIPQTFSTITVTPNFTTMCLTLDELQRKTQQLIYAKLLKKSQANPFMSLKLSEDQMEKQLQALILDIQRYRGETNYENLDSQIKQIIKKIAIYQKIIAQSLTESQILKKYYYLTKLTRKPLSTIHNKILSFPTTNFSFLKQFQYHNCSPSLHFQSMSKSTFIKPNRQAYDLDQIKKSIYVPNRQSLGKTTYQTQYFQYGQLPIYPNMRQTESNLIPKIQKMEKSSIYKSDFKTLKKLQLIDSKLLDCRRDKLMPSKISFMPKKMMELKQNQPNAIAYNKKIQRRNSKDFNNSMSRIANNLASYTNFYQQFQHKRSTDWSGAHKTQYSSNFQGEKNIIQCLSKDSNLSNLKYEFKRNLNI